MQLGDDAKNLLKSFYVFSTSVHQRHVQFIGRAVAADCYKHLGVIFSDVAKRHNVFNWNDQIVSAAEERQVRQSNQLPVAT